MDIFWSYLDGGHVPWRIEMLVKNRSNFILVLCAELGPARTALNRSSHFQDRKPFRSASVGAVSGALTDVGIDDNFMKELGATMTPGSSSLFVLLRNATAAPDKVLEELKGKGGIILKTSLSHEDEAKLQTALNA